MTRRRGAAAARALAAGLAVVAALAGRADEAPFEIQQLETGARVVQADLIDLDGDGRTDLLWTGLRGLPPAERRSLHVHYGAAEGGLAEAPDLSRPLPDGAAAYDLVDLDGKPGHELLLLRRDRLTAISFSARHVETRDIVVAGGPTIAASHDERGLDRLALAFPDLGAPWRLLVPCFGESALLETDGTPVARLDVGARANFFVPPPGPLIAESEIEIYFDHPRLGRGDVDGDGRVDLIATNRHELRVFLQREDGSFKRRPDHRQALGKLSAQDHTRSSGAVRVEPHDFDRDGRVDLLISTTRGSVLGGETEVAIHRNRGGGWNLAQPDQRFAVEGGAVIQQVTDLDGDGRAELITVRIPTGVLEIVEMLLTRAIDAEVRIRRPTPEADGLFESAPWQSWKLDVGMSFETLRSKGFLPVLQADLDGDGFVDLLGSGDGEALVVQLGDREHGYSERGVRQPLDTAGRVRFGHGDRNALPDLVLYDPRRPGSPIRIARNRGVLRGGPSLTVGNER